MATLITKRTPDSRHSSRREYQGMPPTVAFSYELLQLQLQPGVTEPKPIGFRVCVAPPHIGAVDTQPIFLDSGPSRVPHRRQQEAAGSQPASDVAQEIGLLIERHVDESKQTHDGVEAIVAELQSRHVGANEGRGWDKRAGARDCTGEKATPVTAKRRARRRGAGVARP